MPLARREAEQVTARAALRRIIDTPLPVSAVFASISSPVLSTRDKTLEQHPRIALERARTHAAELGIEAVDKARRADPTLGLRIGREADDVLVGVTFSVPVQIRNSFDAQVAAARAEALQGKQQALAQYRELKADAAAAAEAVILQQETWRVWSAEGLSELQTHTALLERLWRSGEMTTTDYLVQLRQTLETRIAGTELQTGLWRARVAWLDASGQVLRWLEGEQSK